MPGHIAKPRPRALDLSRKQARATATGTTIESRKPGHWGMMAGDILPSVGRKMQKVLICLALGATLGACSSAEEKAEHQYASSLLDGMPFVYQMTVQQGNIITEEMVDRLQPGMTKSQVRYLLGTPMLEDIFHSNRWDYTYTIRRKHQHMEIKRLTLLFKDDALVKVEGYIRPDAARAAARQPGEIIVAVPDWKDERGFLSKAFGKISAGGAAE
jgi:outer membrane protein assembly factor BamE